VDAWVQQYHNNGTAAGALSKTRKRKSLEKDNNNNGVEEGLGAKETSKQPTKKTRGIAVKEEDNSTVPVAPRRGPGRPRKNSQSPSATTTPPPTAVSPSGTTTPSTTDQPPAHVPGTRRKKNASTGSISASRKLVGFAPPKKSRHGA